MEKKMKRRSYVRVVSFVAALAAVLVTASICGRQNIKDRLLCRSNELLQSLTEDCVK